MWTRPARVLAASLLTALALTGCGGDADERATDDATGPSDSPTASPTASPTVGSYPEFEPGSYQYTLRVTCFCPDAGVPLRVTVADGAVTDAVVASNGAGLTEGDPAPEHRRLSINDIIGELNAATDAASVRVEWPEGQDYPSAVSIDQSTRIADEEVGYTISDVTVR